MDQHHIVNTGSVGYPWIVVRPDGTPVGPGAGYGYRTAERAQMEADELNRADRPDRTAYPPPVEHRELTWGGRTSARWATD